MSKWFRLIDKLRKICYNNPVYNHTGVSTVEYNYGFLFKKSSLNKASLNALLSLNDFVSEANIVVEKGKGIEDIDIYNIVKKLLFPKLKSGERSKESGILHRSISRFSKTLFGDGKFWENEYREYLK